MNTKPIIDRNLAMETVRVTEAAALAAMRLLGGGDEKAADQAAVAAMHDALGNMIIKGTIRIGEGRQGEVDKLYTGETVGSGDGPSVDVALVPLEGKSIVARGGPNALSVVAMAEDGGFLSVPNVYMEKIAIGSGFPDGIIDLDFEPQKNLQNLADAKGCGVAELLVCLLDRPRNNQLIGKIRDVGARIRLILDGDVSGVIQAAESDSGVDVYMGIGGAQQGVLAAAALRGVNGQMQARLVVRNPDEKAAIVEAGIEDPERKYSVSEMASGNVTFAATGVTYGPMLEGVKITPSGAITKSLVMRSLSGTIRYIEGRHKFGKWTGDA